MLAGAYIEWFRNTPNLLWVMVCFIAAPLPSDWARCTMAYVLFTSAMMAEIVRGGLNSIPKGQFEAAYSQGFTYLQTMLLIILPQTVKIILPPLVNQCVNLIKNTSVLAMIAGGDLMYVANNWATNGSASYGPAYLISGVLYFCLCFPLSTWARRYEEKLKRQDSQLSARPTRPTGKEAAA